MKKPLVKKILLALLLIFVLMQFYRIDKTNPPVVAANDFINVQEVPVHIGAMLRNACYDCHSNETKYPWYTNVMPFSKWVQGHIEHGRKHLNFSEWTTYTEDDRLHLLDECAEWVEDTRMPLASYLVAHSEARISKEERAELVQWFRSVGGK